MKSPGLRQGLVRQAWKAAGRGRFSEKALIDSTVLMGEAASHAKLRQVLPSVWLNLDEAGEVSDWLTVTGLDWEAIDAVQSAIGAGLPERGKKAGLHAYALRPQDFPALLFLVFVAARLATPYVDDGSHRKVRAQFWYAPELIVILMRCLPPKMELLDVEHILRVILQAPVGEHPGSVTWGMVPLLGESSSPLGNPDFTMGKIEFGTEDETNV